MNLVDGNRVNRIVTTFGALKRAGRGGGLTDRCGLSAFTADTSGQLNVFRHNGDPLGVDGAQVGVFEKTDQVGFASFLQSHHGRALEAKVRLEVLRDFAHQTLERQLSDEKFRTLLVTPDFSKSNCAWPVTVRLLHAAGGWSALPSRFRGQLFARSFASCRFTCRLLRTRHLKVESAIRV